MGICIAYRRGVYYRREQMNMSEVKTKVSAVTEPVAEKTEELKNAAKKTAVTTEEKVKKAADTTKKAATKAADTTKKAAVKAADTTKKVAAATKDTAVKAASATKKTAAKAATATKETAKKAKEVVKKALQNEMHIEFPGSSYTQSDLEKIAKDVWVYDMGRKASEFKSVALYVKPDERKVYFVVNGTDAGDFRI